MNDATGVTCPSCSATNPAGAKFCSACAKPLAAGATPPPPQPQYQPPPQIQMPIGGSGFLGGKEEMRQVHGTPVEVFEQILGTIQANGGEIREQYTGQWISVVIPYKNFWITSGATYKYNTIVSLEPSGVSQTVVRTRLNAEISSTLPVLLFFTLLLIAAAQFNPMGAVFFWPLMFVTVAGWFSSFHWAGNKAVLDMILSKLNVGVTGQPAPERPAAPQSPPAHPQTQPSPSAPPAKPQPSSAAEATEDDIMKKIEKLASLRDAGAITADDFEAKKAELLSRI